MLAMFRFFCTGTNHFSKSLFDFCKTSMNNCLSGWSRKKWWGLPGSQVLICCLISVFSWLLFFSLLRIYCIFLLCWNLVFFFRSIFLKQFNVNFLLAVLNISGLLYFTKIPGFVIIFNVHCSLKKRTTFAIYVPFGVNGNGN